MRDAGHRTPDGEKSKNNISTPQGDGHNDTINGVKGEKTILLYKLTEQFPFEVTLCR